MPNRPFPFPEARDTIAEAAAKSLARSVASSIGSRVGREIVRGILGSILYGGWPAFREFGFGFLTSSAWNVGTEQYGALVAVIVPSSGTVTAASPRNSTRPTW